MGLFSFNKRKDKVIKSLVQENARLKIRNKELVNLHNEKDSYIDKLMSDGLRHGSSFAGKQMAEKKYLKNK